MTRINFFSLCLFVFAATLVTSCNKDEDDNSIEIMAGDTFTFSAVQNNDDLKGWIGENGTTREMTSVELDAYREDEAFTTDLTEAGATIEFTTATSGTITDEDGDKIDFTYSTSGDDLTITAMIQTISISFPFEMDGDKLIRKSFSSMNSDAGNTISFSSSGNPWYEEAENEAKDDLSDGEISIYMYYETVYTK